MKRKNFGKIVLDETLFHFSWARTKRGPALILYNLDSGGKLEIPDHIWSTCPDSAEYSSKPVTWHGKHKRGPEFGGYGKRQARELYRKYLKYVKSSNRDKKQP